MNGLFGTGCLLLGAAVYFFLKYLELRKDFKENKIKDKGRASGYKNAYFSLSVCVLGLGVFLMINGTLLEIK